MLNEAPIRGRGGRGIIGKGKSPKTAAMYVSAVRSFYSTFDITVRLKGRSRLPKAKVKNPRMKVNNEQVRTLLRHTRSPRDRALILTMFQGGMDVSTLCSLKYRDVREGLENNDHPLKLDLYRGKTGVEYYTFLGRNAVEMMKAYTRDLKAKGITFNNGTPLFLKARYRSENDRISTEGITTDLVQKMMREVSKRSGLVDERNNGHDFNPLSPHALRESFGSIMTNKGVPDTIVDFWLGHSIGEMARAYKSVQFKELKRMYLEREQFLSVTAPSDEIEERLKKRLRRDLQEGKEELQSIVNGLTRENLELRETTRLQNRKIEGIKKEITELKKALEKIID